MRTRANADQIAGLTFILGGLGFAYGAGAYQMGQLEHMGPGYFPRLLGCLLVALGVAIFVSAKSGHTALAVTRPTNVPWRPLLAVGLSIVFFGLLLKPLGLALTSFGLVVIASFAQPVRRWKEVLMCAAVLSLAASATFAWGLKLPLPVWPAFS